MLVEALTDNRNRTASEVRHLFAKHGGNLGATGAVAWQFERRGVVLVDAEGVDEDELVLAAADAGADDVELDGSTLRRHERAGGARRRCARRSRPRASRSSPSSSRWCRRRRSRSPTSRRRKQVVRLVEGLEENDDVQDVYANFDIPEAVLEAVAS